MKVEGRWRWKGGGGGREVAVEGGWRWRGGGGGRGVAVEGGWRWRGGGGGREVAVEVLHARTPMEAHTCHRHVHTLSHTHTLLTRSIAPSITSIIEFSRHHLASTKDREATQGLLYC